MNNSDLRERAETAAVQPEALKTAAVDGVGHRERHRPSDFVMTLISYALVLWLFLAQFAVVWWKKNRPSQYHAWSLAGLWIIPSTIAVFLHNWRFVAICGLFTVQAAYVFYLSRRRPMNADDPQFIYRIFLVGHRLTIALATLGAALFILTVFFLIPFFNEPFTWLMTDSILFIFYGGYFGVMQRDFSQVVGDYVTKVVTSQIVVTRHGTGKISLGNACGLCGRELRPGDNIELGGARTEGGNTWGDRKFWKMKECGHEFHDECIRGWSVLGKRNVCPTCNERCDTSSLLKSTPWAKSSETWQEFLDLLRMALVWNPLIFVVAIFVFRLAGFDGQR
jgi:RING finger protein 121